MRGALPKNQTPKPFSSSYWSLLVATGLSRAGRVPHGHLRDHRTGRDQRSRVVVDYRSAGSPAKKTDHRECSKKYMQGQCHDTHTTYMRNIKYKTKEREGEGREGEREEGREEKSDHSSVTSARNGVIFRTKALPAKQKRPIYPGVALITSPFDPGGWSVAISAFYSKQNSSDCGVQLRELL